MFTKKLTNLAEVTEAKDKDGQDVSDRDSEVKNQEIPSDEELPEYKEDEIKSGKTYIPGQQDDDDFEKIIIPKKIPVDLALRKFIVAVSKDENIEDSEYLKNEDGSYKRAPVVDSSKLNTKDDIIELYDSTTNRLIETISGNELGELVQKLNMASGIFVNKKV